MLSLIGYVLLVALSVALTAISGTTLWWMLHAWRHASSLEATQFAGAAEQPHMSFSLLVPARHEESVLGQTLDSLADLHHPSVEIIVVTGHDDPGTTEVAAAAAARHPGLIRVVVDDSVPKSKPRAMNVALPHCRGDVVGIFDAEDDVHPELLNYVDTEFVRARADVVQGGVQLMNIHSSWWTLRNCLEYWFWFRSRMHFHADSRFIPLGGNTVFVRRQLLVEADGWDEQCLAEDCELGVRLSAAGATVSVCYDPRIVTREETPGSLGGWLKQRTRWNQGFLQVYRRGTWRTMPTWRRRLFARYTLAMPFLQAFSGLLIPISIYLMLTARVPVPIALLTLLPLVPTLLTLVAEVAAVGDFAQAYGLRTRLRDYVRLICGALPYQLLLALAAIRAVLRHARGKSNWEKTVHNNEHRSAVLAGVTNS